MKLDARKAMRNPGIAFGMGMVIGSVWIRTLSLFYQNALENENKMLFQWVKKLNCEESRRLRTEFRQTVKKLAKTMPPELGNAYEAEMKKEIPPEVSCYDFKHH